MKKGDLSINIIIVAAIALIILVILSVLVFDTGIKIRRGTDCQGLKGECVDSGSYSNCDEYAKYGTYGDASYIRNPTASCPGENMICCIKQ